MTTTERTRREEDEGLTEADMIAERDLDEREADEAAALAWLEEQP